MHECASPGTDSLLRDDARSLDIDLMIAPSRVGLRHQGGMMVQHIDTAHRQGDRCTITYAALMKFDVRVKRRIADQIQYPHLVPRLMQALGEARSDKSRSPRHKVRGQAKRLSIARSALRCAMAMTDPCGLAMVGPHISDASAMRSPSPPCTRPQLSVAAIR